MACIRTRIFCGFSMIGRWASCQCLDVQESHRHLPGGRRISLGGADGEPSVDSAGDLGTVVASGHNKAHSAHKARMCPRKAPLSSGSRQRPLGFSISVPRPKQIVLTIRAKIRHKQGK